MPNHHFPEKDLWCFTRIPHDEADQKGVNVISTAGRNLSFCSDFSVASCPTVSVRRALLRNDKCDLLDTLAVCSSRPQGVSTRLTSPPGPRGDRHYLKTLREVTVTFLGQTSTTLHQALLGFFSRQHQGCTVSGQNPLHPIAASLTSNWARGNRLPG